MSTEPRARLSGTSYAVLGLIGYLEPCTPYDLKRFLEQSVENFWQVPHTTFYAEPARLAGAGYLTVTQEPRGRRRKLYALTDAGREALRAWVADAPVAPPQVRDEMLLKIFFGADPRPLLEGRADWHRRKLAELEGYLEKAREEAAGGGIERSLIFGTSFHRMMVELTSGLSGREPASAEEASRQTPHDDR